MRELLAKAGEIAPDGVLIAAADAQGDGGSQILYASPRFCEMSGYPIEDLTGVSTSILGVQEVPEGDDKPNPAEFSHQPGDRAVLTRQDGRSILVEVVAQRVFDARAGVEFWVVVFLNISSRIDWEQRRAAESVVARFRLTRAEARLAKALWNGSTLEEAAEVFGVTKNTVRTQLRQIFVKTGAQRQSQLIRLLANAPDMAPI